MSVIVQEWEIGNVIHLMLLQFTGSVDEVKQMMMLHLDDAYRAACGLFFTPQEVKLPNDNV